MAGPLYGFQATHIAPAGLSILGWKTTFANFLILILTSAIAGGCVTTHVSVDDKGRTLIHHLGYTRIIKPPLVSPDDQLNVTGYKLVGFNVGEGFTLGYKANEFIQVPNDCRVLIVVNDQSQFTHLLDHIDTIGATDLCATVSAK